MLAPSVEGLPADVLSAAIAARDFYPEFLARLRSRADVPVALDRRGILELATTPADLEMRARRAPGSALALDALALQHLEPQLTGHAGAVLHPHDGAVDNVTLMNALDLAVSREPRIERAEARVNSVAFSGDVATALTTTDDRVTCGRLVLAAGAWMTGIRGLPSTIAVRPVRGQLLLLGSSDVTHVTYGGGGYIVPRGNGVIVGATSEEVGFECQATDTGRNALLSIARAASPALAVAPVLDHWAGLRPMSPDSLPLIGVDHDAPTLVYACGFSRNGILLAPWVANHLAPLLTHGAAPRVLMPFAHDRGGAYN